MIHIERLEHYIKALQAAAENEGVSPEIRQNILDLLVSLRKDLDEAKRKSKRRAKGKAKS